jgi:sialic acid synthase
MFNNNRCYVIAEIGNNHCGDVDLCLRIIDEAKMCGADAVKLQRRSNRDLFTEEFFNSPYDNPNSYGSTYGEHREFLELSDEEMIICREYARKQNVDFLCTAFDLPSVEFIAANLDIDAWKLASSDLRNRTLQRLIMESASGKSLVPIIISTGGYTIEDALHAVEFLKKKSSDIGVLHCISSYPTAPENVNLSCINSMKNQLPNDVFVGYSSHDNGIALSLAARAHGALIIEKHFTVDRSMKGTDHAMSASPTMMRALVRDIRKYEAAIGDGQKSRLVVEEKPLQKMIKSPYLTTMLAAGSIISEGSLVFKVPYTGVDYLDAEKFFGQRLAKDMRRGEPLLEKDLS